MKKEENVLRSKEKLVKENKCPRSWQWIRKLKGYDRICFSSMMMLDAGVFILIFYYVTGIILNIPLTYLIIDILIIKGWEYSEQKRRARETEYEGNRTEIIRQKIEELREIEREKDAQEKIQREKKQQKQNPRL